MYRSSTLLTLTLVSLLPRLAFAQDGAAEANGFGIARYTPTAAGEWSFWVDHPWYSKTRTFAAGLTLDYAHDPLVFGELRNGEFVETDAVIAHQLTGHLDLALSFWDRVTFTASLPIVLLEGGNELEGVGPISGLALGDPRPGVMVRLLGQPMEDAISLHVGALLWIPVGGAGDHAGDTSVRFQPKLVAGGLVAEHLLWSATGSVLLRPSETIGLLPAGFGNTAGTEVQLGAALAYASIPARVSVGPELLFSTQVVNATAFERTSTGVELLLGGHWGGLQPLEIGLAAGIGLQSMPGTPDFRGLPRLAYAPLPPIETPVQDRDGDGVLDPDDLCPEVHQGPHPDPGRRGCPAKDTDKDTVFDHEDECPNVPQGDNPDPKRKGCPTPDRDMDGVPDPDDVCPDVAQGINPDPTRKGCPAGDRDGDGVFDHEDQCPDVHQGRHPAPDKKGCPLPDADEDGVPDFRDACPNKVGAPSLDAKKNGCPGLVQVTSNRIVILEPVHFETGSDKILKKSFNLLQAVADAMTVEAGIKVAIEGHTDNVGGEEYNQTLSERRAQSVKRWLVAHGIDSSRLQHKGYGLSRPIESNKTAKGKAKNRRVEFHILEDRRPGGDYIE